MVTEDELNRLKALFAEREGASPVRRHEIGQAVVKAAPGLVATVERLREAIWPGLPKFVPTEAAPQQDFHEALIESLRTGAEVAEQYTEVIQGGKRLPAPELSQDPAFAAFMLGKLEKAFADLGAFKKYVHERLDAAGVSVDPESPHKAAGCRIGGRLDELIGERDALREALTDRDPIRIGELAREEVEEILRIRYRGAAEALLATLESVLPELESIGPLGEIEAARATIARAKAALAD